MKTFFVLLYLVAHGNEIPAGRVTAQFLNIKACEAWATERARKLVLPKGWTARVECVEATSGDSRER